MRFVFVHGGFHAAWCWTRTIPELKRLGHTAIAVDLPGHGDRLDEESTLDNRRDAIVSALQPGDVVVGHSGGGFDATLAADAATDLVSHVIYLAAAPPREGRSYPEAMTMRNTEDGEFDGDAGKMLSYLHFSDDGAMSFANLQGAWDYFCHDCDEQTARWGVPTARSGALWRDHCGTGIDPALLPGRSAAQLHPLCAGPLDAQMARRYRHSKTRRRALDRRHVAFAVSLPAERVGGIACACDDNQTRWPA
jgi:pimeloyl-ACP methyl ester carboxylesterase